MAVVGRLEIQMAADLARLTKDMDNAKKTVGNTVSSINKALGAIGVGISVSFFTDMVKGVVNVGDKMNDLRKITGLTVEELGGLSKAAKLNGTDLDQVAKAIGIMSKNIAAGSDAFKNLGIETKQSNGDFRSIREVLLDVADRFSQMRDGVQKAALSQQFFGKTGREMIPFFNEGRGKIEELIKAYEKTGSMTTKLAEDSDRFNDLLVILNGNVTGAKNNFVTGLLPALNDIAAAFTKTTGSAELFNAIGSGIGIIMKGIVIAVATAAGALKSLGIAIDGIGRQMLALINLDFKGAIAAGDAYFANIAKTAKGNAEFVKSIIDGDKAIDANDGGRKELIEFQSQLPSTLDRSTKALERQAKVFDLELYKLKQYDDEAKRARDITQSVATEQEIYNQKLEELERLKPYLSVETYRRALEKLNSTTKQTVAVTDRATDEISQLWIQAGRNIQSSLANSIFNFFNDGIDGMVKNVASAVGRIASEFAALKIAQSIGLDAMFGMGGGTGGTGSGVSNALSIASLVSGGKNLMSSGFGLNSIVGGGLSMLPGRVGAFGAGLAGDAIGGLAAGGFTSSAASAASLGSALAPMVGPAMALFAADGLARAFAGNKTFGNKFSDTLQKIPVFGIGANIAAALFGHGPLKFRQQSLQGTASSGGFDGDLTNVFRAKGGLLVGNKHKSVSESFSEDQQLAFDATIKGFFASAHNAAESLGVSTELIDNFTKQVQIKSEKGKTVTQEAIQQMFVDIGNEIARAALPTVDSFRKIGEDSMATLNRLNSEFATLKQGAMNLGASAEMAQKMIAGLGILTRTAYLEAAGGAETFLADTVSFSQKFLTEAERMAPIIKVVEDGLVGLGFSANLTRNEFKELVQTLLQSADDADKAKGALLLHNNALFDMVNNYKQSIAPMREFAETIGLGQQGTNALETLKRSVDVERTRLTDKYNLAVAESDKRIQGVVDTIEQLNDVSGALKSTVTSINPMSLSQARSQIANGASDSSNVKDAIAALGQNSTSGFGNVIEFKRSQAANVNLLNKLGTDVQARMTMEQRSLAALESARNKLDSGFSAQIMRLDSLVADAQLQVDLLNGINNNSVGLASAIGELNRILLQGRGGAVGGGAVSGNPNISSADIVKFALDNKDNPMNIYRAAIANGVTSAQIAATGIYSQKQIDDFVKQNNLASFDVGGVVPRTGLAMIHKNEQVLTANESGTIGQQIERLTKTVEILTIANNKMNRMFSKWDGDGLPPERIVA